jgi:hypothetical protein
METMGNFTTQDDDTIETMGNFTTQDDDTMETIGNFTTQDDDTIETMNGDDIYTYLGHIQSEQIKHTQMKQKLVE